jgi:F0F1-type ATP synthase membrane subunit b/b'
MSPQIFALILVVFIALGSAVGFIVYDEEIFLLMDFCLFMVFAYRMVGESVATELDSRVTQIQAEFDALQSLKLEKSATLVEVHQIRTTVSSDIDTLASFAENQLENVSVLCQRSLETELQASIQQKFALLAATEESIRGQIIQRIATDAILTTFMSTQSLTTKTSIGDCIDTLIQAPTSSAWTATGKHSAQTQLNSLLITESLLQDAPQTEESALNSPFVKANILCSLS